MRIESEVAGCYMPESFEKLLLEWEKVEDPNREINAAKCLRIKEIGIDLDLRELLPREAQHWLKKIKLESVGTIGCYVPKITSDEIIKILREMLA
jgi:hypothetical protein